MKKIILLLITLLLCTSCIKKESNEYKIYEELTKELQKVDKTTENIPLNITIEVSEFNDSLLTYSALIDKDPSGMYEITGLLIHNKKTDNMYPSTGIFDEKISLQSNEEKKGIKLTGYVEKYEDIEFKLLIKYKTENNEERKYYYIYEYSTNN